MLKVTNKTIPILGGVYGVEWVGDELMVNFLVRLKGLGYGFQKI